MDTKPANPLARHFRTPAIYIKLPSGGEFWPADAIDYPESGEFPVYPMTAQDEITLKTPDALLNGQGVVDVIQSCCPNIKNAWDTPSIDVDTLLIAVRIASYGDTMDFSTKCPKCGHDHEYGVSLSSLLGTVGKPDYSAPLEFNGLKIKLVPQRYFSINKTNMITFEEERILQLITDESITDEERKARFDHHLKALVELNIRIAVDSTESIVTPEGVTVRDREQIAEFYANTDNRILKAIQTRLQEYSKTGSIKSQTIKCSECSDQFELPIVFDYANFFV